MAPKKAPTKKATSTGKKPDISKIVTPSKQTPIKDKQDGEKSKEELLAEIEKLKQSRGGRKKIDPAEKATIRVSFYISPNQEEALQDAVDFGKDSVSEYTKDLLLGQLKTEIKD